MTRGVVPRSVSQELASLDKAIEAAENGYKQSPNDYDASRNFYALGDLKELRGRWQGEQAQLIKAWRGRRAVTGPPPGSHRTPMKSQQISATSAGPTHGTS